MTGRVGRGSSAHRQPTGRGCRSPRSIHPPLLCLVACVLAAQVASSRAVCSSAHRPTLSGAWRRNLDFLSTIARDILDDDTVVIPNSYTDEELAGIVGRMRELAPELMESFDAACRRDHTRAMDSWIWMCRGLQTLGRRRKRGTGGDESA